MLEAFRISYGEEPSQFGILRVPNREKSSPIIVTIHGGFWQEKYDLEENTPLDEDLTLRGFATWNIEYRRVGEEGGGWPGTFNDVIDAVNHLKLLADNFKLDLSRIIILGHSAGGQLALWLAAQNKNHHIAEIDNMIQLSIRGVISLAGVNDLNKMWEIHKERGDFSPVSNFLDGSPSEVSDRYKFASPIELLPLKMKQIIIHGADDRHVPAILSADYYHKALEKDEDVHLTILPDVDHFQIIDPLSISWKSVIESLKQINI